MRIFEIQNEETNLSVGVLLYFETARDFIIELDDRLDEWTIPLLFSGYLKKHIYTIPRNASLMWVKERVIPPERQNISSILKNHRLKAYDEMKLLELSHGKCSQDSLYIRGIDALPDYAAVRARRNILECIVSPAGYLICFFADNTTRKIDMNLLSDIDGVDRIMSNNALYMSGKPGPGGYCLTFNNMIDIPAGMLYERGEQVPITLDDFRCFVKGNVMDTTQSCEMLDCTRQNISYMITKDQLFPLKEAVRGNLYLKGDVLKNIW